MFCTGAKKCIKRLLLLSKMEEYKTIASAGSFEQILQKSTFIAIAAPAEDEAQAMERLKEEKKRYPDARHHCWAYRLGAAGENVRCSDDGEPQGTAGVPILECLKKKKITDAVIVVTRYFGGILLGAGGLARAYASGASGALDAAKTAFMGLSARFEIFMEYTHFAHTEHIIKSRSYIVVENIAFSESVCIDCVVKQADEARLERELAALTNGRARCRKTGTLYYPWEEEHENR